MNSTLFPSPPTDTVAEQLADWLELAAFSSDNGHVLTGSVNSGLDIGEDFEPLDLEEQNELREGRLQATVSAIDERLRCMNGAYPFSISEDGESLGLSDSWGPGGTAYLLCLVLSHSVGDGILPKDLHPDLVRARDLFQICATASAGGICRGPAFSLGFPRPDGSSFLQKLAQIYEQFGEGRPRSSPLPGAPKNVKDGGIDVVAWGHELDGLPGKFYLLGQAGSGRNWNQKSIRDAIAAFHNTWFEQSPASQPTPYLFIPFCLQPGSSRACDFDSQEQRAETLGAAHYLTSTYGNIQYRYRIPLRVQQAVRYSEDGIAPIERLEELGDLQNWLLEFRVRLQDTAAA